MCARYGMNQVVSVLGGRGGRLAYAFPWCRGISLLGYEMDSSSYWFSDGVVKLLRDGCSTSF